MITHEEKIVKNVVKQLDGLSKIEAYDILHKIEGLLINFNTPIAFNEIKKVLEKPSNKITVIGDHGYCYLEDSCQYLSVYKIKSIFPYALGGENLYFTIAGHYELIAYNNRNIIEAFSNMHLTAVITQFSRKNNVKRRNSKTNRLLLLDLFDHFDPND